MSRISKGSSALNSGASFQQVLAEVGRAGAHRPEAIEDEADGPSFSHPLAGAIFSFDPGHAMSPGGGAQWSAALAWMDEQDEPIAEPPRREDTPESVQEELGPIDTLSHEQLNQLRRLYMWRNHPDRSSETQKESATKRVAIANMLLDRAQMRLTGGRRA